jgi:dihydroorotase
MKIRISNGTIIDPANNINETGDVCIGDGTIVSVNITPDGFNADQEIDATGKIVIPGIVDLCARFREPGHEYKATINSESVAAASAGITTICCPPDTKPIIDTSSVVELIHQRVNACGKTQIYPLGALTYGLEGERLADMQTLVQAGCVGVSNATQPIENTEVLRRAMEYASSFDITVFIQPEDSFLRNNGSAHEGPTSTKLGLPPYPEAAETIAVSRIILLAELTGARVHFCRLTSAKSIELVSQAREAGLSVTADVSITHLHHTDESIGSYDTNFHLIPPLRTERDRQALIQGVAEAQIDCICSDHQPHDVDAKAAPFTLSEPGASTLDALYPMLNTLVESNEISIDAAIAAITCAPAKVLGLDVGTLGVDTQADLAIIDNNHAWQINKRTIQSAGKNSPFIDQQVQGKVTHTILAGEIVYDMSDTA